MRTDFDAVALFAALDAKRVAEGLSWAKVADALWEQSSELNAVRGDHPISASTLTGMPKRGATSCQHALFMLRWIGATPEHFVPGAAGTERDVPLPPAGPGRRLRWNLKELHAAMDARRQARGLTWAGLATELHCTANQLTALRTAKFATNMALAMRITGWLGRPAADFVYAARW